LPADDFSIWGLSVRVRDSGLGAPLIARREGAREDDDPLARFRNDAVHVPATLFLRLGGGLGDLERGITAELELHSSYEPEDIAVGGRKVPLESDFSATLAWALDRSELWGFSSRGFFGGAETRQANRLFMVRPPEPGLVPVVFVHGTASNPAYWAEMFNLLQADPRIREHMQFWFFQYSSGTLISFSAARLRAAMIELVKTLDPDGKDAALRRIVVIGHSQGGLLAKLMAVDSDMSWWDDLVGTPFEEFDFSEKEQQLVRSALDFDPVPGVQRVVYISTPHGGSFLADRLFARLIAKLIALPGEITSFGESLQRNEKKLPPVLRQGVPTSLDNMRASNPFLKRLARAPLAPGVTSNSIIAIGNADPAHPQDASDGVVKYKSAHVEGVESEFLVPAGHSCQSNPRVISELRRILMLHLRQP